MATKQKIVIVGGGFGGVYAARYLSRLVEIGEAEVTIVSRANYFLFTPLLHEVATGGLTPLSVVEPIREIFRRDQVKFVEAEVKSVNKKERCLLTSIGKINYDYLILAVGAETNFYDTPGAEKYTCGLKNLDDALAIRSQIIASFEQASVQEDKSKRRQLLTVAVIGGGPTGVELAGELTEFMGETLGGYYQDTQIKLEDIKVLLVSATNRLLAQFPEPMSVLAQDVLTKKGVEVKTNAKVLAVEPDQIILENQQTLAANLIIWVAGVKPGGRNILSAERGSNTRLQIDEYLRVVGQERIFALGDLAGTWPMLAQVAVQQARTVAHNIGASIDQRELKIFKYRQKGLLVSLGQWQAVGNFLGLTVSGRVVWWLWRTIYLFNFLSWRKRFKIAAEWTLNLFYPRDITHLPWSK